LPAGPRRPRRLVTCHNPGNRHERTETGRFRPFGYDELLARDKASLDIFWVRDESLEDTDNLPPCRPS
jgi:type I restriction enzyme M protein